jgi:hypothetical protein
MNANIIRSGIFLVAGLILILFPKAVFKFQSFFFDKLKVKYNKKEVFRAYPYTAAIFFVVAVVLFVFGLR